MTRTERTYYLISGLYWCCAWFLGPMYALFLLSRGLDLFQIHLVLGAYLLFVFLLEVPTGAVADRFGRRFSFVASCIIRMLAFGLYSYAEDFGDCLIAELIDAFGTTLATGALDAWAVDGMRAEGDDRPKDAVFARAHVIMRFMMIGGGIAAGYLAQVDMRWPWVVAAGGFGLTALIALRRMTPHGEVEQPMGGKPPTLSETVHTAAGIVRHAPVLLLLCVLTYALFFASIPAHMLWQPRLTALSGREVWVLGWIWALLNVATLVASAAIPVLIRHFSRDVLLFLATGWRCLFLGVAAAATSFWPALVGFLAQEATWGATEPLLMAWTNEHAPRAQRATVLSVRSMFGTLGGATGLVILGLTSREAGIPVAWASAACVFGVAAPGFLLLRRYRPPLIAPLAGRTPTA